MTEVPAVCNSTAFLLRESELIGMRIHVVPGDIKLYKAAFHDDECLECAVVIAEGDPIGYVDRDGPYCYDCTKEVGTETVMEVT